jgi:hypothetical protein
MQMVAQRCVGVVIKDRHRGARATRAGVYPTICARGNLPMTVSSRILTYIKCTGAAPDARLVIWLQTQRHEG